MAEESVFCMPIPELEAEDISMLTEKRQKMLISLLHGEKTLSRIMNDTDIEIPTALKALRKMQKRGFVERDSNKVYKLTESGRLLALFLAKPNGMNETDIITELDKILKEKNPDFSEEERKEIIESMREDVTGLFSKSIE